MGRANKKYPKPTPCRHHAKKIKVRGLCPKCYTRWLRNVNPSLLKRNRRRNKEYYRRHKAEISEYNRKYKKKISKAVTVDREMRSKYGIGLADYNRMARKQRNRCLLCRKRNQRKSRLHIDHDHVTKIVRGLLCFHCNSGLGHFFDNSALLIKAALYLRGSNDAAFA